ncbi:MAG: VTT domain-containing protein [Microvirga sp.]
MNGDQAPVGPQPAGRTGRFPPWRYLPLGIVLVGIVAVVATGAHRSFSLETLAAQRDGLKAFADAHQVLALCLFVALYAAAVFLSIPVSAFFTIVGGFLFGWRIAVPAALFAATLGATGLFLIVRTSLGETVRRRAGPRVRTLAAGFRRNAGAYLLFLRFTPMPFWITNIAAALFHVPLKTFLLTTPLGMAPITLAFAVTGSGLDDLLMARQRARAACLSAASGDCDTPIGLGSLLSVELVAALAGLGILSLLPVVVRRWQAAAARRAGTTGKTGTTGRTGEARDG